MSYEPLPEQVRQRRLIAGISLDLVAQHSGVSRCSLSLVERGLITLPADKLKRISDAINELSAKRLLVANYASEVGWPMPLRS
jgi:transcriptional regulator with XRE-family HTH domain